MGTQVWEGEECASSLFRSRLWGTFTMLSTMIMKPDCWVKHMALDPETGLDPPGIRIRPAQGLEAADNFLGAWFWVRAGSIWVDFLGWGMCRKVRLTQHRLYGIGRSGAA